MVLLVRPRLSGDLDTLQMPKTVFHVLKQILMYVSLRTPHLKWAKLLMIINCSGLFRKFHCHESHCSAPRTCSHQSMNPMCGPSCEALKGPKRKACAPGGVGWGSQAERALHSQAEPLLFFIVAFNVLLKNFIRGFT